ncbi:hypothetical protein F8C76_12420 [Flagellimonas olearia]|uniref:Uncharacterized protein n=1 Tax=Flagellimonas olearia TaxID=552546 RepID=A0A6I1DWB2_9FLAO|nr:hypothetical protein [Allomuricauda olearia]KAB7528659.1 hypothetical protein F8C76_12420 [Allomuricauda olearia]
MADQPVHQNTSDEIDLRQLFQLVEKGFNKLGTLFLRLFLYLKKNAIVLFGLVILGAAIGYGLKFISTEKLKVDVIVRPYLHSKDYLYDVVSEIEANIKVQNEAFFQELGISSEDLKGFQISIEPVKKDAEKAADGELEYLEVLQKFEKTDLISDILREEVLNQTELNHRITFEYKSVGGDKIARKLMDYINSNEYFKELVFIQATNSKERINKNEVLISQIDTIIKNYSSNLSKQEGSIGSGQVLFQNEERVNVAALLNLKTELIKDTEDRKIELSELTNPIGVINFGTPHQVSKAFFSKKIILIPLVLVAGFFLFSFLLYLNKKAAEMEAGD